MMMQALMGFGGAGSAPVGYSTGVITQATWTSGVTTYYGFNGANGSSTGTSLPAARTLAAVYNRYDFDEYFNYNEAVVEISGFGGDPGISGYFVEAVVGGVTLTAASASYSYLAGTATWAWPYQAFGLSGSGTVNWTLS